MTDDRDLSKVVNSIAMGLDKQKADVSRTLSALKDAPIGLFELIQESATFVKQLAVTETPSDPNEIKELSKDEIVFATYRANFFEKIRMPALTDEQLEYLQIRAHELWGEHPTEPLGRWVDWCLWTHVNRRQHGIPITEVIAGNKTAGDLKQAWIGRHQAREERRRFQKVDNYERYETPEDVPTSIQQLIMSPFIQEPEVADIEIETEAEQEAK